MAERWTRKQAEDAFELLCGTLGKSTTTGEVGRWRLEHGPGGYTISQLCSGGGESSPMGYERHSAKDFCSHVHFALRAIELTRRAA